MILFIFTAK